jgi:hypothetical protein
MDWILDSLTPCTYHSELQLITALSTIFTLYKSPQHPLNLFPACCVFTSSSLTTASNSGDSSASRAQVLPSPTLVRNNLPDIPSTELERHLSSSSLPERNCTRHSLAKPQLSSFIPTLHGPNRKHRFQRYHYCCLRIRCRGNMFSRCLALDVSSGSTIQAF